MSLWSRFANLWRSAALDREFEEELRFHAEMRAERNMRFGLARGDAEAEARRHLGSELRAREGMHEARVMVWLESVVADLQHGARLLRKHAGGAALAIITLSLGIGANTAIFTLLNAILLRPLPYPQPDRLFVVVDRFTRQLTTGAPPTIPEILDVRERSRTLAGIAFFDTRDYRITGGDEPARVLAARVSASLFRTLGIRPALGRLFVDLDNLQGHWNVAILSDGLWQRNFGADPAAVGRTFNVNGAPFVVVGVLPADVSIEYPGLAGAEPIEMYVPFTMYEAYTSRAADFVNVRRVATIARLRDGVSPEQASAELFGIGRALAAEHTSLYRHGGEDTGFRMDVVGLQEFVTAAARSPLMFLLGAVLVVLLIACLNTGQFVLAQSLDREQEIAVRASLGASRGRLFRQFLSESMLLAGAAGVLGLLQAHWLVQVLLALVPGRRPELDAVRIDWSVLAFTCLISVVSAAAVGVLPALYFSRRDVSRRLGVRGSTGGRHRARHVLVAAEVAAAVALLTAAGVLIQGISRLQNADHGFSAESVTVMQVRGTGSQATRPIASTVYQHFVDHLAMLPGIEAAASATPLPFRNPPATEFALDGSPIDPDVSLRPLASYQIVSPDYFRVFRIPIREGRAFTVDDVLDRPRVAIVSETLARRHVVGESAIGHRIRVGPTTMTIVGVAGDLQAAPLQPQRGLQIYVSNLQQYEPNMNLAVRVAPGAVVADAALKKAIWSVSPDQAVFNIQPMAAIVRGPLAEQRYVATLLSAFAALALFVSAAGVYTVVSYVAASRTREMAIRMAVGAQAADIIQLISGQTFAWTLGGLSLGLIAAFASRGMMRAVLPTIADPGLPMLAGLAACYVMSATIAVALPVTRALRHLDPSEALRTD